MKRLFSSFILLVATLATMAQGWPNDYKGVMLQGFYWDSYKDSRWAKLETEAPYLAGTFDLVWIPQSGKGAYNPSMGYDPLYWFEDYYSSFGSKEQLLSLIKTFKDNGIGTIGDVVINHRGNLSTWNDFPSETYNGETYALTYKDICSDDEAASKGYDVGPNKDTGENWDGMRDLDHKSENVQRCVKAYLKMLLDEFGYAGFRYDMVKGYAAEYTKMYNEDSKPTFSVGECWDGTPTIRRWIDGTGKTSAAFDFQFRYTVRNAINKGDWSYLGKQNDGNWPLISNDYEDGSYRQWAITFVENHDTEKRSNAAQDPIKKDTLAANAYLLAMPGTPCIFLKHWNGAYQLEIKAMVEARKLAGIKNTSSYSNFRSSKDYYANTIDDKLMVVVGNEQQLTVDAAKWTKILAGYHYAYYLANTMETAWVPAPSGTYEHLLLTLMAATTDNEAKLVYTLDGSEPSATNGTQVEKGSQLDLNEFGSYTLKVGLLSGGTVKGIVTRHYTLVNTDPEDYPVPEFCTFEEGEVCAFFEAPTWWEKTIYCWAWTSSPAENFTSKTGTWPGIACEKIGTTEEGNAVWKWKWDGTKEKDTSLTQPEMIIFSSEGSPQTEDMSFVNGGYYTDYGLVGMGHSVQTAIRTAKTESDGFVKVYSLDGRLLRTAMSSHEATAGLPKGIYIVNKKKLILK